MWKSHYLFLEHSNHFQKYIKPNLIPLQRISAEQPYMHSPCYQEYSSGRRLEGEPLSIPIRCRESLLDKWLSQTDLVQFLNQLKKQWRGCKREKIECNECVHRRRDAIARGRVSEIAGAVIKVLGRRANSSAVTNYGVVWDSMPRTEILEVIAGIVLRGM